MLIKAHLERFFMHRAAKTINQCYIGSICSNHVDGRTEMTSSGRDSVHDPPERGVTVYVSFTGQKDKCASVHVC